MAFGIKERKKEKKKENLSLSIFLTWGPALPLSPSLWPFARPVSSPSARPNSSAQPARALPLSLPFLLWCADPTTRVADGLAPLVGAVFYLETARSRTPYWTVSQSPGRVPPLPDPAR
jgi:hypothetical protein